MDTILGAIQIKEGEMNKPDQRGLPICAGDVPTTCKIDGKWQECKWGEPAKQSDDCTYYIFELLCTYQPPS